MAQGFEFSPNNKKYTHPNGDEFQVQNGGRTWSYINKVIRNDTTEKAFNLLKSKYNFQTGTALDIAKKKTKTGEMPYSGMDYYYENIPDSITIQLNNEDTETLKSIGFELVHVPDQPHILKYYRKGNERMYFFANGKATYYSSETLDFDSEKPIFFNSVKQAMLFLWDKHSSFIEESFNYKQFMENWI